MAKKAAANQNPETGKYYIPPIKTKRIKLKIMGDTSFIAHRKSEQAIEAIRKKQQGEARGPRGIRKPEEDYRAAQYRTLDGKHAIQAIAIKKAMVRAASFVQGFTMVEARGLMFVLGDRIPIKFEGQEPIMREDMVPVGRGGCDLRYRPEYQNWSVEVTILYDSEQLTPEQIINILNRAGFHVGVGDWRPEKDGQFGMFHVVSAQ